MNYRAAVRQARQWVDRGISERQGEAGTLALLAVLIAVTLVLDAWVLPTYSLAAMYAVPMLIAAHRLRPASVTLFTAISVAFYGLLAMVQATPPGLLLLRVGILTVIGLTSYLLAKRLREAQEGRQAAEQAKADLYRMVGMVAHELRGPLTGVKLNTELLAQGGGNADAKARVDASLARLERLTADLLDTARVGSNRLQVHPYPVDLAAELQRVVAAAKTGLPDHQVTLQAPPTLSGVADGERLGQVLENLISNAAKFSPAGTTITVELSAAGGEALIEVRDQGIGIPADRLPGLFQPFRRLHESHPAKGTGLGLYITQAIITEHGGRIWAESGDEGTGTCIAFTLPLNGRSGPARTPAFTTPAVATEAVRTNQPPR